MTVDAYLHQGKQLVARWAMDRRLRAAVRVTACALGGALLSAAGLAGTAQPLAMALTGVMSGWRAAVMALGSMGGYLYFWGRDGLQGVVWSALAGLSGLILGNRAVTKRTPLLIPALNTFWVAATGLVFLLLGRDTPTLVYLLRVALAWGATQLFGAVARKREPLLIWCAEAVGVLALARIGPGPWLNFGVVAAGMLAAGEGFPAAVLAGLALDLARVSQVPMTAVMAGVCFFRMLPGLRTWMTRLLPGAVFLLLGQLCGVRNPVLLPGLLVGGCLSVLLPMLPQPHLRRGETGLAQVRLELMAQALQGTRLLLLETEDPAIDEEALLARTRERSCGSCPNRRTCHAPERLPRQLLHQTLTENTSLPFFCKKPGRMTLELRRTQEQLRLLRADRDRRREYRGAVSQQYLFLSEFLRDQSDGLARREKPLRLRFAPEVSWAARPREVENGDRFRHFSGPGGRHFLLLCDGMGTGIGAAQEGKRAISLLQGMLTAGFPPEHALESLNSLLALGGRAGAVTVDLAELRLDTGAALLYKWGAAPSYLLRDGQAEKIGTAGPPPGIRGSDVRQQLLRLSLRRGEYLVLVSDGADEEALCRRARTLKAGPTGEMAARLLEAGARGTADDASVAVVRLRPERMLT